MYPVPFLATVQRHGYGRADFTADTLAYVGSYFKCLV